MLTVLLVKTSSLGDIVHNLPVVADIRDALGDVAIDWVVERSFASIPAMHPGVRLPQPGKCPICEMPLIPAGSGSRVHDGMLHLQGGGAGLLETAAVERRALQHTMRAVGKIGYNESGLTTITSRVEGYVEKLFVNFTGVEVKKGDHFAEIYSPDLAVAQRELQLGKSDTADRTLLDATRKKLERWGLQPEQIDEFLRSGKVTDRVTLLAPRGGTVTEKLVVQNSMVKPGETLYRLAKDETKPMVVFFLMMSEPTFEVSRMMVLRKSTTRPVLSVSLPSSRIWSSMFITSGWAFSISSKSTTQYGLRRTCSVSWPPSS